MEPKEEITLENRRLNCMTTAQANVAGTRIRVRQDYYPTVPCRRLYVEGKLTRVTR